MTVGPNQYASCTVRNRIRPGTIEIEKNATPESSQVFAFTGSARHRQLHAGGRPRGRIRVADLHQPHARDLHGQRDGSGGLGAHGHHVHPRHGRSDRGDAGDDHLARGGLSSGPTTTPGSIRRYRWSRWSRSRWSRRADAGAARSPEPPAPPASTELRVVKIAPRVARVGDRLPFRLRVTKLAQSWRGT